MTSRRSFYERIAEAWPPTPSLTFPEAARAAKRLFRYAKVRWPGRVEETSGNRNTWVRRNVLYINTTNPNRSDGGWRDLVHMLSHYFCYYKGDGRHSKDHARMELRLVKEVVKRGWLDGRLKDAAPELKPAPTPEQVVNEKLQHAERMLAKAMTRLKRANTIAKKWARRVKRATR